jgi:putative Holliday junction resolvase
VTASNTRVPGDDSEATGGERSVESTRVLAVDLGSKRIGLALSDPTRTVASPHAVLPRGPDHAADHAAILTVAREAGAGTIVVGLPLSLSGRDGPAAHAARAEAEELRAAAGSDVEVVLYDERLTTVTANAALDEARVRGDARKHVVDKVAAAVLLQAWLERNRA